MKSKDEEEVSIILATVTNHLGMPQEIHVQVKINCAIIAEVANSALEFNTQEIKDWKSITRERKNQDRECQSERLRLTRSTALMTLYIG